MGNIYWEIIYLQFYDNPGFVPVCKYLHRKNFMTGHIVRANTVFFCKNLAIFTISKNIEKKKK